MGQSPWRSLPGDNNENLNFVKSYQPRNSEVNHLRILLYGPVGAGKSSFINSVGSVLKGGIVTETLTDATSGSSHTLKKPLKKKDKSYNPHPTLNDKVHVLVCVIPTDKVSVVDKEVIRKLREIRLEASDMGIPQLAILTKVDESCDEVKKDIRNTYYSKYTKEQLEKFSMLLGIQENCIFLVKNYCTEMSTDDNVDALIMAALRQMLTMGEDFLNNQ